MFPIISIMYSMFLIDKYSNFAIFKECYLKYFCYPEIESHENTESGFLKKFLNKDLKKYPDLKLRVTTFLKEVKNVESLDSFINAETISYLSDGYYEMRIPPQRRGGVVRIYFIKLNKDNNTILLIDAELKKKKKSCIKNRVIERIKTIKR